MWCAGSWRCWPGTVCTITRSFCYWPDFVPEPEHLDEAVVERFADFLDAHAELGLGTIPTFIVGHMSGQNWDPAWRGGRDLYRDVWLVAQQAWFAEQMARRFARHNENGYSLRALATLVDFIGPHVYPMSDDVVRQSMPRRSPASSARRSAARWSSRSSVAPSHAASICKNHGLIVSGKSRTGRGVSGPLVVAASFHWGCRKRPSSTIGRCLPGCG
jgi:hypothetical protein